MFQVTAAVIIQIQREPEMHKLNRQKGATLIELLISVVIGLIIAASMLGMYVNSTANSSQILKSSKLNQELTSLMTVMVNDIRRAGYAGDFLGGVADNKFTYYDDDTIPDPITNVIRIPSQNCILYAYNIDTSSDLLDQLANTTYADIRGFRLINGAVEMLSMTGTTVANIKDNNYCNLPVNADVDGDNEFDWRPLTDPATTRIETLAFDMEMSSCLNLELGTDCKDYYTDYLGISSTGAVAPNDDDVIHISNQVGIQLSGKLVSDETTSLTIGDEDQPVYVKIRNDILWKGPLPAL
jgi:type IV pilus assembly protein PilW